MTPEIASVVLEVAGIAGGLVTTGVAFGGWLMRQTLVTKEDLRTRLEGHDTLLNRTRDDLQKIKMEMAVHRQEDATVHARVDGEIAQIREVMAALPTQRDLANVTSAIERMRVEITAQLGTVSGDIKAIDARLSGLHGALERTQTAVDRHEQIISDAAARQRGSGHG